MKKIHAQAISAYKIVDSITHNYGPGYLNEYIQTVLKVKLSIVL